MSETLDFIKRVVNRCGLKRERFADDRVPSSFASIRIIPFFGDWKSEFVMSTLLLHRLFRNDYLILLSWPGHSGIFDTVSEYWTVDDHSQLGDLVRGAAGHSNPKANLYERMLLKYFDRITSPDEFFKKYYDGGFTSKYFAEFADIEYMLPSIPSANMSWGRMKQQEGVNVFISPSKYVHRWTNGGELKMVTEEQFWTSLIKNLVKKGMKPVIQQNYSTHDMSHLAADCFLLADNNIMATLAVMRACDCIVDVFNGLSRLAMIARVPYFCCDERQRYFETRDYVLDDLCGQGIQKEFMYSFSPMATGQTLDRLTDALVNRLSDFVLRLEDRNHWPSTVQTIKHPSYDIVRHRETRRIGTRFIKVPKLED